MHENCHSPCFIRFVKKLSVENKGCDISGDSDIFVHNLQSPLIDPVPPPKSTKMTQTHEKYDHQPINITSGFSPTLQSLQLA